MGFTATKMDGLQHHVPLQLADAVAKADGNGRTLAMLSAMSKSSVLASTCRDVLECCLDPETAWAVALLAARNATAKLGRSIECVVVHDADFKKHLTRAASMRPVRVPHVLRFQAGDPPRLVYNPSRPSGGSIVLRIANDAGGFDAVWTELLEAARADENQRVWSVGFEYGSAAVTVAHVTFPRMALSERDTAVELRSIVAERPDPMQLLFSE